MFIFLSLSTQYLVWIVTGTGIAFTVIFYIGTKEPAVRSQRKINTLKDPVVYEATKDIGYSVLDD